MCKMIKFISCSQLIVKLKLAVEETWSIITAYGENENQKVDNVEELAKEEKRSGRIIKKCE